MKKVLCWLLVVLSIVGTSFGNSIQVELENDAMFKSDKRYTHGTRITYEYEGLQWYMAQTMYTPPDISADTPLPNNRPYAGVLCFGLRGTKFWHDPRESDALKTDIYRQLDISVGVVGESSKAEEAQNFIHKRIGAPEPMGWDYQTENMLWLQLGARGYDNIVSTDHLNLNMFLLGDVGTVISDVGAGAQVMLGYNVPISVDKPIISIRKPWSVYFFGEASSKYVFSNKLIENNHYVDVKASSISVVNLRYGLGLEIKDVELKVLACKRSKEFHSQEDDSIFGSVSIKIQL
jgi:hypothetical protein